MQENNNRYFAASNTFGGFVSYYDRIFGGLKRIYVIKGGPGTGKSRLISELGKSAEGRGLPTEYFYCSFDPDSLDGLIVNKRVAVVDGTAPHIFEPRIPGALDVTVDLSGFWNRAYLESKRRELCELNEQKSRCFELAYLYLSSLGKIYESNRKMLEMCIKRYMFVERLLRASEESPFRTETMLRIRSSFGRAGIRSYSSYEEMSQEVIYISDEYDTMIASELMKSLVWEQRRIGNVKMYSCSPLEKNRPDAIMLNDQSSVIVGGGGDFDVSEFLSPDFVRLVPMLKENSEIRKTLISCAEGQLRIASELHSEIEKIYISAMNFAEKEKFAAELVENIDFF